MAPVSKAKGKKAVAAEKDEEFIKVAEKVEEEEEDSESDDDDGDEDEESEEGEDEEAEAKEDGRAGEAVAKKPKTKANRLKEMEEKDDEEPKEPRGVIYIGHIPQGFFEPQMKTFFTQFGKITRIRLSRSKKNGALKGYGFIEFEEESVAKIVADTMHKYLLFGKQLVCHLVPKEKQHKALFKGWKNKLLNRSQHRRDDARALYNDRPTTANVDGSSAHQVTRRQTERRGAKERKLRLALESIGIDFDANAASGGKRTPAMKPKKDKEALATLAATAAAVAAAAKVAKSAAPEKAKSPKLAAVPAKVEDKKRKQAAEATPAKEVSKGQPMKKKAKRKAA